MWLKALWDTVSVLRSGGWRSVRAKHLRKEPECQCCSRSKELEVHHIHPVHAGGKELDPENLITLCRDCHFVVGHACDWHAWRPDIRAIAKALGNAEVRKV